jgi:hypothetical protein
MNRGRYYLNLVNPFVVSCHDARYNYTLSPNCESTFCVPSEYKFSVSSSKPSMSKRTHFTGLNPISEKQVNTEVVDPEQVESGIIFP